MPRSEYRVVKGDSDYGLPYRFVWFDENGIADYSEVEGCQYASYEELRRNILDMLAALDKPVVDKSEI